ncbi:hypothetical protein, partial [Roseiflexus castenholzii]|uniref:hypothetical protein n=1 Tax=Roseiflexus castenholzii TaxID=120962 RepID=UPI003C7E0F8C
MILPVASRTSHAAAERLIRGDAPDDALDALAQAAAQQAEAAVRALVGMPPATVARLPDEALAALAQAAAQQAEAAAQALVETPPPVLARLPGAALDTLA